MKQVLVFALAMMCTSQVQAFEWRELFQRNDQRAYQLLQDGDPQAAAELFDDAKWRGASQFRAGNIEEALVDFSANDDIDSIYNRGVAEARAGQYDTAVETFEEVLSRDAEHEDAAHNLEIAKELQKQQQQNQQQQQDQQQDESEDEQGSEDNQQQQEQKGDQNTDEQSASEDASNKDEGESQEHSKNDTSQQQAQQNQADQESQSQQDSGEAGELSEQASQQASSQQANEQAQQALREQLQQEFESSESPDADTDTDDNEQPATVAATQSLSEDQQATEQWLRRIPDDPSQLLRNKIKLNHMLEHSDVGDTKEPW